jgi:hypothetical protein
MSERPTIHPVLTWRSALCDSGLPATARHVALTISIYMNERGGSAYPGGTRLAEDTGLSLRTVRSALAVLEQSGWLTVVERGGATKGSKRTATIYQAAIPTSAAVAPVQEIHRCNSGHRPVQLTTPTGATAAPQVSMKLEEKLMAPTDVDAVEISLRSAVLEACDIDPARVTRAADGAISKAVNDLAAVGATLDDVPAAARSFRERYPHLTITPPALAKHWPQLLSTNAPSAVPALSEAERFGIALGRSEPNSLAVREAVECQFDDPADRAAAVDAWTRIRSQMVPA